MNVIEQLKREEGCVLTAYNDHLGYVTIGVGRLIDKRRGGGITQEEADYLLSNDVNRIVSALSREIDWFGRLNEPRQAALIGMAFQMGVQGLLSFRRALAAIRDERWDEAAEHMLASTWAMQTPSRAQRMAQQIKTGDWQ